jgi:methylenetetrahydrofolate reductase (NADPH)
VGATVPELRATLDEMQAAGIDNVLALRGDPPEGQQDWTKTDGGLEYSRELVGLIGSDYDFAIGAACFPETHIHADSADSDLRYLAEKVGAGVDFLITQMFFDNDFYFDFVRRARGAGVTVPIIPGIMPITRVGQVERMATMCGSEIPQGLRDELHAREQDAEAVLDFGVAYATLLAAGAPGIHFYTLNRSPATRAIVSALKLARPWERAIYPASISNPSATRGEPSGAS